MKLWDCDSNLFLRFEHLKDRVAACNTCRSSGVLLHVTSQSQLCRSWLFSFVLCYVCMLKPESSHPMQLHHLHVTRPMISTCTIWFESYHVVNLPPEPLPTGARSDRRRPLLSPFSLSLSLWDGNPVPYTSATSPWLMERRHVWPRAPPAMDSTTTPLLLWN